MSLQLFFEEDGQAKAASVLKHEGNAYQVEFATGKRSKIKGGHVFFEFDAATSSDFMERANQAASEIDPRFLWEACGTEEFGFEEIAKEYFGTPSALERAAVLLSLHANPVYFYRKGRGHFKAAPEEILQRALEAVAKRERMEKLKDEMVEQMKQGALPESIGRQALQLLIKPDKNSIEYKALNEAAGAMHLSQLKLLLTLKAIPSLYAWHVDGFYCEHFPHGKGFPSDLPAVSMPEIELPTAAVEAFSIDDSLTTEIDDAASVEWLPEGKVRIGIHIAAPAFLIERDDVYDRIARDRLSTVYAPGLKTTMLPDSMIAAASLDAGKPAVCVSLYALVDASDMTVLSTQTRLERVCVKANLRYENMEAALTEEAIQNDSVDLPFAKELCTLWRFAKARQADRERYRGKPEAPGRREWSFILEGTLPEATIKLTSRQRGAPCDLIVAELMIFANATWGLWLEEHGVAGIYRSQRMGRVKMGTVPGPHDGLGVERYAWSTSPLRRYVDLVNQRQIIATAMGRAPAYEPKDTDLYSIVSSFEATYDGYNDFQRRMERYWSMRWIEQEGLKSVTAVILHDELVRLDGLPMTQRVPGLPAFEKGQRIELAITGMDYVELVLEAKLKTVLEMSTEVLEDEEPEVEVEVPEESEDSAKPSEAAEAPTDSPES